MGVIEGSRADVSFVAGLLIDKFAYHLPLYRQHQRLSDSGITVSRPWLTQIGQQGAGLLEPIYEAQFASIRASRVKAMDETPIKAGRAAPGKMKAAYFWPVYGELDEVCFPFFESRRDEHVEASARAHACRGRGAALRRLQRLCAVRGEDRDHARPMLGAHEKGFLRSARRRAQGGSDRRCDLIGALYEVEARIRASSSAAARKLDYRLMHAKPIVEHFFAWVESEQFEAHRGSYRATR